MKKIIKMSLAIISLAAFTNAANAAVPGNYFGLGVGPSIQEINKDAILSNDQNFKTSGKVGGFSGRIFAGYNFNQFVGLELGASRYAKAHISKVILDSSAITNNYTKDFNMTTFDFVGKAYLPVVAGFNLYALGGGALVHTNVKQTHNFESDTLAAKITHTATQNRIRPKFGAGVSYDIPNTKFSTNLELSRIVGSGNLKKDFDAIPNSDMLTLNISYNFD